MEQTVKVLNSEKQYLKKAYETQVKRSKEMQEKHYLIKKEQPGPGDKQAKDEDPLVTRLQQEVRSLHHRLMKSEKNGGVAVVDLDQPEMDRQYEKQVADILTGKSTASDLDLS